jgi:endonuclease/exonuclease/phosphatase (EEP) superfamily protein YafD
MQRAAEPSAEAGSSHEPMPESRLSRLLAAYPIVVVALTVVELVIRARNGPLAIFAVLEPLAFVAGLLLAPATLIRRARTLRLALVALVVVGAFRFGGEWVSAPATPAVTGGVQLRVVSWNLEFGARPATELVDALATTDVDVVALQELTPGHAAALTADPRVRARYPYQIMDPHPTVLGSGVLSRLPITDSERLRDPVGIRAVIRVGEGSVTLIDAHPLHGDLYPIAAADSFGYDTRARDASIDRLRATVDEAIGRGERVALVGDFNTASSEPAYDDLGRGLRDVHAEVGLGPGWTWRPTRLSGLPFGLVRIDYVFVSPRIVPLTSREDCSLAGDHCRLFATLSLD